MADKSRLSVGILFVVLVGAILFLLAPLSVATAQGGGMVVVSGLDNPRGMTFDASGNLWIAEAGRGDDGSGGGSNCIQAPEGLQCYGPTGGVTMYDGVTWTRMVSGLPSIADFPTGTAASGPTDVALDPSGQLHILIGWGGNPISRTLLGPAGMNFGRIAVTDTLGVTYLTDLAGYEGAEDPDNDAPDSNPWALVVDANRALVSDAGGNDIVAVSRPLVPGFANVTTETVVPDRMVPPPFPPPPPMIPMDSVPTGLVQGPGGIHYFGELTGFPFPVGAANVYQLDNAGNRVVFRSGFTNITDIAFGPDGTLYVLQISATGLLDPAGMGSVIAVASDDSSRRTVVSGLFFPTGMVYGPDDMLYIANNGIFPGSFGPPPADVGGAPTGQVIQVDPSPPTAIDLSQLEVQSRQQSSAWFLVAGTLVALSVVGVRRRRL